ncbi:hydroxyacylglutathione hydrolase [Gorgonomyces haynaldii]|nr:hydroxyacylglutathione hydrolase [Gorgonomyces haynaldii]
MKITPIPLFKDNYCYLLQDLVSQESALVDPALSSAFDPNSNVSALLVTHHHADHAGQVHVIAEQEPQLKVYAADDRVKGIRNKVQDRVPFHLGTLKITPIFTPCHTAGSVSYFVEDTQDGRAVFTGDTLFSSGCGRFFEGNGHEMYQSLSILASLPKDTLVFCGHEYTLSNLRFAKHIEPENPDIQKKLEWAEQTDYTMPSTIESELLTNPFVRVSNPELQKLLGNSDPVSLISLLREQKNNF